MQKIAVFVKIITIVSALSVVSACSNNSSSSSSKPLTLDGAYELLSTNSELNTNLAKLVDNATLPIEVGPLIENDNNNGLINIDQTLTSSSPDVNLDVCGVGTSPTIREAVVCTIDSGPGNTDLTKIGKSNHGRELLAARVGNRFGTKVMIITQQHGNEPASTEAAMTILEELSQQSSSDLENPVNALDILFVIRANPDGGEPTAECTEILPVGMPSSRTCAFSRSSVDSSAGGGFLANSEEGFSGVVGQGYNLNRYHFSGLDGAIRPVEVQAIVAASLAFNPEYVLDLHGDTVKTDCELDLSTIIPNAVLGVLPTIECLPSEGLESELRTFSPFADSALDSPKRAANRALSSRLMAKMETETDGTVGRFAQIQLGAGSANNGTASIGYADMGSLAAGWETLNFGPAFRPDVVLVSAGEPVIANNTYLIDPEFIVEQIRLNEVALRSALSNISEFVNTPPNTEESFCDYPLPNGMYGTLPTELWGEESGIDELGLIPMAPAIGVPLYIAGDCPEDSVL
jgi:hypothetical protein